MGGLGNQLFQIAAGYAHCRRNGLELKVSAGTQGGRGTYWDSFLHKVRASIGNPGAGCYHEPHFHYSGIAPAVRGLIGYFQSSKYFADYADEIRALFDPTDAIKERVRSKYADLIADESCVVLHIRRGDYVALPKFHCILNPDYYARAVAKQGSATSRLIVFSDDIAWCSSLPFLANATFVDEPADHDALYLMSQFSKFVISNSSFSWWASWLSTKPDKCVIAPDRWFGPDGPQDFQDIYEPWWTQVPVTVN